MKRLVKPSPEATPYSDPLVSPLFGRGNSLPPPPNAINSGAL